MKLVSVIFWGLVASLIFGIVYLVYSHFMILHLYATFDLQTASLFSHPLQDEIGYVSAVLFWIVVAIIGLGIYILYLRKYNVPQGAIIIE